MESLVRDQLISFLRQNKLLSDKQYGFLGGRSTVTQLLRVMDEWTAVLDSGGFIENIYLDFQKAFDSVPHRRLLTKLEAYGIKGHLLGWLKDFLIGRTQEVKINGISSPKCQVTSGIPQGSVLGPILFIIYINDLPSAVNSTTYMYADDTKIYNTYSKDAPIGMEIQQDITSLENWSNKWLLKFNKSKCKQMWIYSKHQTPMEKQRYFISSDKSQIPIENTLQERDLGINIDQHLLYEKHMNIVTCKASRNMGIIRRTIDNLDKGTFVPLYTSLVRAHLEYGQSVWNPYLKKDIAKIESVQRNATRKVNGMAKLSYPERLKKLGLTTLRYRRLRGDMIECYKIIRGIYDANTCPLLSLDDQGLRGHSFKLKKNRTERLNLRKYFFTNRVVNHWNSLTESVVSAPSVNAFKNRLDVLWADHPWKLDFNSEEYSI